eukprot:27297_1
MINAKIQSVLISFFAMQSFFAMGHGGMRGQGWGWGQHDDNHHVMMDMIHNLIDERSSIERQYTNTTTGIESYTNSSDLDVTEWIQTHVYQMVNLMESENGGIRLWDPLFHGMFELRDFHGMNITNTTDGVHVVQSVADDDELDAGVKECTKQLIQNHAEAVTRFVDHGYDVLDEIHPAPEECSAILV